LRRHELHTQFKAFLRDVLVVGYRRPDAAGSQPIGAAKPRAGLPARTSSDVEGSHLLEVAARDEVLVLLTRRDVEA
jgi:hypothetical protein